MADRDPRNASENSDPSPADQTGEHAGVIKRPQQTGEKNVPRGSEPERHARK